MIILIVAALWSRSTCRQMLLNTLPLLDSLHNSLISIHCRHLHVMHQSIYSPRGEGGNPQDSDSLLLPQGEDSDRINWPHPQGWGILTKAWPQGQPTCFWQSSLAWEYNFWHSIYGSVRKVSDAPLPPGGTDWLVHYIKTNKNNFKNT